MSNDNFIIFEALKKIIEIPDDIISLELILSVDEKPIINITNYAKPKQGDILVKTIKSKFELKLIE